MNITLKCRSVANYIIEEITKYNEGKSLRDKILLSTKRLQKLVYFCEVEYMKRNHGKSLFEDQYYAWPSGPIIPEIYSVYMQYQDGDMKPNYDSSEKELSCDIKLMIDEILDATKKIDTSDLIKISKVPGGPHEKVFDKNDIQYKTIVSKKSIYDYYAERDLLFQLSNSNYHYGSLAMDDIVKLKDKNLQLRYLLGGLYPHGGMIECNKFLDCDSKCSTRPVLEDEKFNNVRNFMSKHNMSNETFIKLTRSYLMGTINSYKCEWGDLIPELDSVILDYNFVYSKEDSFPENDLKEKELVCLIMKEAHIEGTYLNSFLKKYSLTSIDFMILAKTSVNYKFKDIRGFQSNDMFFDLEDILIVNDMYLSCEYVKFYRKKLKCEKHKSLVKRIKDMFKK